MARLKFESITGVAGYETTNPLTILLKAPSSILEKLKKKLTVTNKSVAWKVNKTKKSLEFWASRDVTGMHESVREQLKAKVDGLTVELSDLEDNLKQEFFHETPEGLEVPAGFWWIPDRIEGGIHENIAIKTIFVEGLRDYQIECLTEMYKYNRATGVLATGLGKSLLIASLCVATVKAGRRACVVVPTEYLVGQMLNTISDYIKNTKAYGGKHKALPLGADVLVITAQSAAKFITDYHTIIIDESHHAPASTWVDLLTSAEKATHVYNLTATAFRADGLDLAIHAFGGPVVYEKDTRWGIANGWLKPLKVFMAIIDPLREDGSSVQLPDKMPMAKAYGILSKNKTTMAFAKKMLLRALSQGRRVIVLFKTVKAGEEFKKFCKPELAFDIASSKWKKPIDEFRDGTVQVLVSNDRLVSEGLDIPAADCLITMIQNSSDVTTYQATGRVLRLSGGRKDAIVIDIATSGYSQFERAQNVRGAVYSAITDSVSSLEVKK